MAQARRRGPPRASLQWPATSFPPPAALPPFQISDFPLPTTSLERNPATTLTRIALTMRSNPELPGTVPQPYEPLYRPHGVFEHTCGQRIVSENEGMPLKGASDAARPSALEAHIRNAEGCAPENAVLLKKGTLGGKDITYVEKKSVYSSVYLR